MLIFNRKKIYKPKEGKVYCVKVGFSIFESKSDITVKGKLNPN